MTRWSLTRWMPASAAPQRWALMRNTAPENVQEHSHQVAVLAQRHYLVSKSAGDVPQTSIAQIEGEDRVAEVARMLSGDASELSLAHAREMLVAARG